MPKNTDLAPEDGPGLLDHPDTNDDAAPDLPEVANPDEAPGEQLDTGEDIGKTKPVLEGDSIEHPIDAPAAAVDDPGPTPITPASSAAQYESRVKYENMVNGQFAAWLEANRGAILDTFLAGGTVELTHNVPDADDRPDTVGDDSASITPKS